MPDIDLKDRFQASWTQLVLISFAGILAFILITLLFVGGETVKAVLGGLLYGLVQFAILAFALRRRRAKDEKQPGEAPPRY